jgi:hypothetical protein
MRSFRGTTGIEQIIYFSLSLELVLSRLQSFALWVHLIWPPAQIHSCTATSDMSPQDKPAGHGLDHQSPNLTPHVYFSWKHAQRFHVYGCPSETEDHWSIWWAKICYWIEICRFVIGNCAGIRLFVLTYGKLVVIPTLFLGFPLYIQKNY